MYVILKAVTVGLEHFLSCKQRRVCYEFKKENQTLVQHIVRAWKIIFK